MPQYVRDRCHACCCVASSMLLSGLSQPYQATSHVVQSHQAALHVVEPYQPTLHVVVMYCAMVQICRPQRSIKTVPGTAFTASCF